MQSSTYVLDMDLKNGPVQIANNDLNRTNHDHTVLDIKNGDIKNGSIIDPQLTAIQAQCQVESRPSRKS